MISNLLSESSEIREFRMSDVTELEMWIPVGRVENVGTFYVTNYVGDSDGIFIVLDAEPERIIKVDDVPAFRTAVGESLLLDVDWLVYSADWSGELTSVEGTDFVTVENPWNVLLEGLNL